MGASSCTREGMMARWDGPLLDGVDFVDHRRRSLDEPGSMWSYRPYAGVDGGTFYLRIPEEEPYPGYLIELERRDGEEGLELPVPDEPARPIEIQVKKFGLPITLESAAHCWLAFSDPFDAMPDWVREILDRAEDQLLFADT
jgi:hypothetical protein